MSREELFMANGGEEGGGEQPQTLIISHVLSSAFGHAPALRPMSAEESQVCARRMLETARGGPEIDEAMRSHRLVPVVLRARGYTPFSKAKGTPKAVVVVPYNSSDEKSDVVGGIGLSEGEPTSGVIVHLENQRVREFVTLDLIGGKLVQNKHSTKELIATPARKFADANLEREAGERHLTVDQSAGVAGDAFRMLIHDEYSRSKYTDSDVRRMVNDAPLVTAIAEMQYMRLEGLTLSPGTSCCSCCCCCWGSCSSCSAASSKYLSEEQYRQWTE